MNYFVNENIFTLNSGTEFSAINRLKMFQAQGIPAKILTRNYNSQLYADMKRVGLAQGDVLNMYDYFQEIVEVEPHDANVRYVAEINKNDYHIEGVDANSSLIKYHSKTIAKVNIAPATMGLVGNIEFYNDMNVLTVRDVWDRRGFKSATDYFHPDGSLGAQVFLNQAGEVKLEVTHMNVNNQLQPTMYKLIDYKGRNYRFNSEQELFLFFLNEIAAKEPSVFINDRPSLIEPVALMQNATAKWQFIHNIHSPHFQQAGGAPDVFDNLQPLFENYREAFDGVIVPTQMQRDEIVKFHRFKNVVALPDTFVNPVEKIEAANHDPKRLIYVGRMAIDRNPQAAIEIVNEVKQRVPDVQLDIYGYASPFDYEKQVKKQVEELGLQDNVNFKGYLTQPEIEAALDRAGIMISTAPSEGFGMNMLEAMGRGVPVVAFRVKYGPETLIQSGQNGILINGGNIHDTATAVLGLISNRDRYDQLATKAWQTAKQFDLAGAWDQWQTQQSATSNLFTK